MNRENEGVFEPTPIVSSAGASKLPSLVPLPGPDASWTAKGVITALEPLTGQTRQQRLRETLARRLDCVTVVFDQPHDPHNGSAVLRSCDAFGVQRVHIIQGNEKFTASRMVSKGSERWVDVVEHTDPLVAVEHLKKEGFKILVTHPQGELLPHQLSSLDRVAIVLGNERDGVSPELTASADNTLCIPMCGFVESLNVSVTAAILLQAACQGRSGDLGAIAQENTYARWLRNTVPRSDEVLHALQPC